ncbi:hypothetical protein HPB49_007711 [Dermacentor silvarum]|uniref:Uncharacterized protein n=1 Tax=Dermacentor silvarum TaxID=543639 RepID=A0ACB8CQI1_DERSI|nr:hypothetical protein HPB49_007711 [Dermacentor silvarum]
MIVDYQMCVQVQGKEISPEQFHNDATWTLVGERMSRLRQPPPQAASPMDPVRVKQARNRNSTRTLEPRLSRQHACQSCRWKKAKVVVRPSGGLDIVKTGSTTVAAAKIKSEESAASTICPKSQQNIMIVSRPNENNETGCANIKEILFKANPTRSAHVARHLTAP